MIGIITFQQTAAEAGIGRAVVDTIPVLSDVVSISEDYAAMHEALKQTIIAYDTADKIQAETNQRNAAFTQRLALDWYKEAAGDITISDATRIDLAEVGRAVRAAGNEISLLLNIGHQLSREEMKKRIDEIKANLKERLRAAARQLESFRSAGGNLS